MRQRALKAGAVLLALLLAGGGVLLLRPDCLILQYTGLYCTGCGVQHMALALLRGDLGEAARQNLFMLLLLPVCLLYVAAEVSRYIQGKPLLCRKKWFIPVLCGLLVLAIVFTVLRNLPGFRWLAPAWASAS